MRKDLWKRTAATILAASILATSGISVGAAAPPDGYTDASTTVEAYGNGYKNWLKLWNGTEETDGLKKDWTQMSLTPGSNESELNFAWYSVGNKTPKLKIGKGKKLVGAKTYTATQTDATESKSNVQYKSNKVTATGLEANTTYYYSYQKLDEEGKKMQWTTPEQYTTQSPDAFSFIYVGDPQIGSSNPLKGADTDEFYNVQSDSVANDSFNWNTTLNQAMEKTGNKASFILSAGDQIQTTKKKAPNKAAWVSEIEYAGYLSPEVLDNVPVATTVGNHDADNPNYTYHFNTPNNSALGSNGIVGGDYWFTYGDALFMMLNTQDTNVAEHKQFIKQAVDANKNCKWRIITLHQDIYGSAEHSNEPEITNLRYQLVPYFEEYDVDVVLTGHDHAYSRSQIMKGGVKTTEYTDDEFDEQLDKDIEDIDGGENPGTLFVGHGNIKADTTDPAERSYLDYLDLIMDKNNIEKVNKVGNTVINPEGILYMTANSSSGSKYYDLVARKQSYIASRWQEDVPTYSVVDITDTTFTINTYRTDTDEKIDETFTIAKLEDISGATITGVSNVTYTGNAITPAVTVQSASGKTLTAGTDYTVAYNNNVKVGKATVVITGTGKYTGTKEISFSILPNKVALKSVKSTARRKATVKFAKVKGGVTGYEVTYSVNKKFTKKKVVRISKNTIKLKKLKSKKSYYVKVRAFKVSGGEVLYGKYSKVKKVKVR